MPESSTSPLSRRALVRGAAWAVPTAAVAGIAPAYAASPSTGGQTDPSDPGDVVCDEPNTWDVESKIDQKLGEYYAAQGFTRSYVPTAPAGSASGADGALQIQHFVIGSKLAWRLPLEFEEPMKAGSVSITIPADPSWKNMVLDYVIAADGYEGRSVQEWFYHGFDDASGNHRSGFWKAPINILQGRAEDASGGGIPLDAYRAMPVPQISRSSDEIKLSWSEDIPAHSMLILQFLTEPADGTNIKTDVFTAKAIVKFTPNC